MLKTFRDMRETIGSFISILIIIFIGCFFFAGIATASRAITKQVDDYYDGQNLASVRAEYMYVNSAAVDEIAARDGVTAAAGYDTFYTRAHVRGIRYDMTLCTLTPGIDDPYIVADINGRVGHLPEKGRRELLIDSVFAEAHRVGVGDTVTFDIDTLRRIVIDSDKNGIKYAPEYDSVPYIYEVCGVYHSPDTVFKVNMRNTSARTADFIMAYVNYGEIPSYTEGAAVYFNAIPFPVLEYASIPDGMDIFTGIKLIGEADEDVFSACSVSSASDLTDIILHPELPAGLYMYMLEQSDFPSVSAFNAINDTIAALAAVLPLIFFAVAGAITVISMTKTVDNQRMQIGVIQALGISKGNVYFSYIFYALFASLIGGLLGSTVGVLVIPWLIMVIYSGEFSMPPTPLNISVLYLFLSVIISAALACLAAYISCNRTLRVAPAQAMRPKPPKKTKRILVERWTGLWKRLGFGAKMNMRNMFLHKTKMLLSSVGIVGCLALLIGLIGLKDNMAFSLKSYNASACYDVSIVTDVAVEITPDSPIYDAIAGEPGEEYMHNLTFVPDFSATFEFGDKTASQTLMALPTYKDEKYYRFADADCIKLYTDLNGKNRVLFESDTFVIPEMLASKLGAKAGDTVKVSGYTLDNRKVEFEAVITAVVYEYFDQKAYCAYDVFTANGVELVADTSYATLLPGVDAAEAIKALSSNESVRAVQTFRETFDTLAAQMSLLDYAVIIFVVGAAALAVAVIYNITATNLKERTREIATLMVLGYKRNETANIIIAENMVITLIGCALGLPLGYGLLYWLVQLTQSFSVFISGFMSWYVAVGCVVLTFVFSLIATLFLNRKMKDISMVEALKSVE